MARKLEEYQQRQKDLSLLGKPLARRAKSKCELCGDATSLKIYELNPQTDVIPERCCMLCDVCSIQLASGNLDPNHWYCLNDAMWSEIPVVQALSFKLLNQLQTDHGWRLIYWSRCI